MADFTFDAAGHHYYLDGVRLPSVTQLINAAGIGPDFSMIPPHVLEAKRALGLAVHSACELDDLGELDDDGTDPLVMRYVEGWRRFRMALDVAVLANEQRLYHPTLRFAGTLDRVVNMATKGHGMAGAMWILDLKTGDDPYPSYGVQLSAYRLLLAAAQEPGPLSAAFGETFRAIGLDTIRRGTVHLRDDGTYRLHPFTNPNDEAAFRACLALNAWKEATR